MSKMMVPVSLLLLIVLFFHYRFFVNNETDLLMRNERVNTELLNQVVTADIGNVISDTRLLADYFQQLMSSKLSVNESSRQLLTQFLLMSKHKRLYDHIRLLDIQGNEITRVNFNSGAPLIVPKAQLQNKSSRYYFKAINQLQEGEMYISPLDLNVEGKSVEMPLKPTIRFGMALYRYSESKDRNEKNGLLILNYDARNLITRFKQVAGESEDQVMMVNDEGYWLISPNPGNDWGFMFNQQHTFQKRYPEEWRTINESRQGQFSSDNGIFTYAMVSPYLNRSDIAATNYWKIISHINNKQLNAAQAHFISDYLSVYLIILGAAFFSTTLICRYRIKHRKSELQTAYESRFRQTLENIQLAAVTIDTRGIVTFCNERLLQLTGYSYQDAIGSNWYQRFSGAGDAQTDEAFIGKVLEVNQAPTESHESHIVDRHGNEFLIAWSTTPIHDSDGHAIGITLIGEDISDKRKNEEQLLTLNRAVEQSPSTVMITDINGNIEYVNKKFEDLTGYSQQGVIGKNPSILKSGATSQAVYKSLWKTVRKGLIWSGELKNRKKNGDFYWESVTIAPVRNPDGEVIHFISLKEDITEKKQLEKTLEERNQEILRNRELAAVGKMANMIAHDLRNPLTSIKMTLQMIGKHPLQSSSEQMQELSQISLDQIRYMESIITDVMNYSRPDALKQEWISLPRLIESTLAFLERTIDKANVEITTYYQPGLPTLYADPVKLQQTISNLVTNSIQSVEEQTGRVPHVMISTLLLMTDDGGQIKIEVKDNGSGIDYRLKDKVFEPFYTGKAKGTGLGLAIVKRIVEQHAGRVTLEPMTGGGSCATIQLPILPPEKPGESGDVTTKVELT